MKDCKLCDLEEVETEYHVVFICKKYDKLRTQLYKSIGLDHDTFSSFDFKKKFLYVLIFRDISHII